jgi:hypothetical protein
MQALKVIKLLNGDELIGLVDTEKSNEEVLYISGIYRVKTNYIEEEGTHEMYLIDWFPAGKSNTLPLNPNDVLTLDEPIPALENNYYNLFLKQVTKFEMEFVKDEKDLERVKAKQQLIDHDFSEDPEQ